MTRKSADATMTVEMALAALRLGGRSHRPLSDRRSSYGADNLEVRLGKLDVKHVQGARSQPMTHGKIEHWYQTLKT
jgi:hypothetical protein